MKAHYTPFLFTLALGTILSFASCQEDEVLNLETYPVNQPSMSIKDAEGKSKVELKATYQSDGTLALNGLVSRTYMFHFTASPEDATVTFDILNTNIPKENVEISDTKVVLPAGYTDASVTLTLKNEDFSFATSNYDAATYELGVKATVEGSKIGTEPIESKVVIAKEAYIAGCSVVGKNGNSVSFERAYSQGSIVNPDPISYTFNMKLDKPARKDVKVKLSVTGLDEKYMSNITVTPAEIIIPAGELSSEDVTWSITDDFLLTTADPETHTIIVTASAESEDPVVAINKKENVLTFNVEKVFRNFGYISNKLPDWVELAKTGWSATTSTGQNGSYILDGIGGTSGRDIYINKDKLWFIVDMKSERTFTGFGVDYYPNSGTASSPRQVTISTSSDNKTWIGQGTMDTPQSYNHYFQSFVPLTARYLKVEMSGRYNNYIDLTEVYVYNAQ